MQQYQQPTSTPNVSVPAQTIDKVLAAHRIEPELLGTAPRHVVLVSRHQRTFLLVAGFFASIVLGVCIPELRLPLLVTPFLLMLRLLLYSPQESQKKLLASGIPRAAVVTKIKPGADNQSFRVSFAYETSLNPRRIESVLLTQGQIVGYDLHPLKSFTVLVNSRDEYEVMPYFLIDTYNIAGVRRPTPAKVYYKSSGVAYRVPTATQGIIAADPGVETELFSAAPRRIAGTRTTNRRRLWMLNALIGLGVVWFYLYRNDISIPDMVIPFVGVILLTLFFWCASEARLRHTQFFLRNGYAVRAIVDKYDPEDGDPTMLYIRYAYPRSKTETGHGYLTLSQGEIDRLGGMEVGTTFTVLRHPTESFTVLPYFQIRGVEIPGARQIYTTPPGTPTP